jgi:hypothetical protein
VEFSSELRADALSEEITVSFRLWRPKAKVGRRYRVDGGQVEVDSVELGTAAVRRRPACWLPLGSRRCALR